MLKTVQLLPRNYLITYYQTLEEVSWLLRQEKLDKTKMIWNNLKKIANFIKNFQQFERLNGWKQIHWN